MTKFHINKQGLPGVCRAKPGCCPLGDSSSHFSSKQEAETYITSINESKFGLLSVNQENSVNLANFNNAFDEKYLNKLNRLNEAGYEAYFVGGAIRDTVLGMPAHDVDITTSATPEQVLAVFSDHKTMPIGIEHGTVVIMDENEAIEITTFREDGEYTDSRRPDDVTFTTSLLEDVKRRDFTINSLAYSERDGLVDLVGGVEDINNRIIKTVGNPDERFKEDPLRIMRGLRFASKLDFEIEKETEESIFRNKDLLKHISAERLQKEFDGLLMGKNSKEILNKYSSVISVFIPEVKSMVGFNQNNPAHIYDVWEHSTVVVENSEDNIEHKLAAIFHDSGKPETYSIGENGVWHYFGHAEKSAEIAEKAMTRLKYPTKTKKKVLELIIDHDEDYSTKKYKIAKKLYENGPERFFDSIKFMRADDKGKKSEKRIEHFNKIEKIAKDYLADSPILSHKDLDIKAKDIMELGFKGKEVGEALNRLSLLAMSGHPNEKEAQINYLIKNGVK